MHQILVILSNEPGVLSREGHAHEGQQAVLLVGSQGRCPCPSQPLVDSTHPGHERPPHTLPGAHTQSLIEHHCLAGSLRTSNSNTKLVEWLKPFGAAARRWLSFLTLIDSLYGIVKGAQTAIRCPEVEKHRSHHATGGGALRWLVTQRHS